MERKELEKALLEWNGGRTRKPLVLMGARQVGKTWLMEHFAQKVYPKDTVLVNLMEDEALRVSIEQASLDPQILLMLIQARCGRRIVPGRTLLIIDEIQESPRALTALKFFSEKLPELAVMAAGSLLGLSLRHRRGTKSREPRGSFPVGKVSFLDVHPLTFAEFLSACGEDLKREALEEDQREVVDLLHDEYVRLLKDYLFVGGMPEAVKAFVDERDYHAVRRIQKEILRAYDADFVKHADETLLGRLRLLWKNIPAQLAKENKKYIYKALKEGARGRDYEEALEWLDEAGMVHQVFRASPPRLPLKAYEDFSAFKLYQHDVGLLGAMSDLPPSVILEGDSLFTNFKGALTEQFVLQELVAMGVEPSYWSAEKGDAEVDFLVQGGTAVYPIEVKAACNLKAKSLATYRGFFEPPICYRTSLARRSDGNLIRDVPLFDLLRIAREIQDSTGAARRRSGI